MATINTLELNIVSTVDKATSSIDSLIGKMNSLQSSLHNISNKKLNIPINEQLGEVDSKIAPLKDNIEKTSNALNRFTDKIKVAGQSANKLQKNVGKVSGSFEKLFASIKRIALYRAIRTFIKLITEGIKTGIQNLVKYEVMIGEVGGKANKTLSSLKTNYQYISNSIGSLATSLLATVTPVIDTISDGLVEITNLLNQFVSALSGSTTYKKATKANYDYAESIEAVKRQTLGFDELNILNNNSTNEGGTSYTDMFTDSSIYDGIQTFADKVKNTFSNLVEDIKNIWGSLKGWFSAILSFDTDEIEEKTKELLSNLNKLVVDFFTDLESVIPDAMEIVNGILQGCIDTIETTIMSLLDWIEEKTGIKLDAVKEFFSDTFGTISSLVENLSEDISIIFTGICETIEGVLEGDWSKAWNGLVTTLKGVWYSIVDIVNAGIEQIVTIINLLLAGINKVFGTNWHLDVTLPSAKEIFDKASSNWTASDAFTSMASIRYEDKINAKASGGFVPNGDLFLANEAGAELITSATGGAEVYNQDQLAGSVANGNAGVIEAIYTAISSINNTINNQPVPSIKIGDRDIYESAERGRVTVGNNFVRGF